MADTNTDMKVIFIYSTKKLHRVKPNQTQSPMCVLEGKRIVVREETSIGKSAFISALKKNGIGKAKTNAEAIQESNEKVKKIPTYDFGGIEFIK